MTILAAYGCSDDTTAFETTDVGLESTEQESPVLFEGDEHGEADAPLGDGIAGTQAATTTNWGGSSAAQPLPDTCLDDPSIETCCSPTQEAWIGTDGPDSYLLGLSASPGRCTFAEDGDDHLRLTAFRDFASGGEGDDVIELRNGGDAAIGGPGHDRLTGGLGGDTLYGQDGDDILQPGAGPDWVDAGAGDDAIDCSLGSDTIFPGPGRDTVEGGPGDDHVWIRSSCEVESGEILRGGLGHDTLHTAIPIEDLVALGVHVQGFETIDVLSDALPSSCDACTSSADCSPERPICTQLREGVATCRCEPRFTGDGCTECAEGGSGEDCLTCLPGYHLEHVTRGTHPRDDAMLDAPDPEQPVAPESPSEFVCVPDADLHCANAPGDGGLWCSGRGSCSDDGAGNAACTCDAGYAGPLCDQCEPGMERNEDGECVFGQKCRDDACHGAGDCTVDAYEQIACDCDPGFGDVDCGDFAWTVGGEDESLFAGNTDGSTVRVLRPRRRDGAIAGPATTFTIVSGPGSLVTCPGAVTDDTGRVVARCSEAGETIYVAPTSLTELAVTRIEIHLDDVALPPTPTAGPSVLVTRLLNVPKNYLPITGKWREELLPIYENLERFMLARGVRAGVFGLSRGQSKPRQLTRVGIGWRDDADVTTGVAEPFRLIDSPPIPPSQQAALRMREDTPMRVGSVSKPMTAAAVRGRLREIDPTGAIEDTPALPYLFQAMPGLDTSFDYNRTNPTQIDPAWQDMTIRDLLHHSAGLCRGGATVVNGEFPGDQGNSVVPFPVPGTQQPVAGRSRWAGGAALNSLTAAGMPTPPTGLLNPAQVDVDGPLNNGPAQAGIPFPYSSSEIAVQRLLVMNDLLQDCLTNGNPLAICVLSDRGVYTDRALLTFVLGLTPIFPPGALPRLADNRNLVNPQPAFVTTAYGQCPAYLDTNGDGFIGGGDAFSPTAGIAGDDQEQKSYSNFAYLMLGHVLTALEGETYTFDSPGSPPGWGPGGTLVASFIQERTGVGPDEVYPANFANPDPREPAYRQLRLTPSIPVTPRGAPSRTVDLGDPRRYRFNVAQSQWESCTSAPEDCASPGATWARIGTVASLNARQVDVAWSYGTGSGMVITVNAMLRFMQGHVISRGDRSPYAGPSSVPPLAPQAPVASDYAGEYTGLRDEQVPADVRARFGRLADGHGGQLQGVWAAATRLAAACPPGSTTASGTPCPTAGVIGENIGDQSDLNVPAWDTTDNPLDAWNLFGPSLASGPNNNNVPNPAVTASYVALPCARPDPTTAPVPGTIPVGLSQNVDFVWFLNQWQDPTGTAAAPPTAPDVANRYNFRGQVLRNGLCQVEQAALDPTEPIPWPTPLGPTFPGEIAP